MDSLSSMYSLRVLFAQTIVSDQVSNGKASMCVKDMKDTDFNVSRIPFYIFKIISTEFAEMIVSIRLDGSKPHSAFSCHFLYKARSFLFSH